MCFCPFTANLISLCPSLLKQVKFMPQHLWLLLVSRLFRSEVELLSGHTKCLTRRQLQGIGTTGNVYIADIIWQEWSVFCLYIFQKPVSGDHCWYWWQGILPQGFREDVDQFFRVLCWGRIWMCVGALSSTLTWLYKTVLVQNFFISQYFLTVFFLTSFSNRLLFLIPFWNRLRRMQHIQSFLSRAAIQGKSFKDHLKICPEDRQLKSKPIASIGLCVFACILLWLNKAQPPNPQHCSVSLEQC